MKFISKLKENSAVIKEYVISALKFIIFSVTMVMGFWLIYGMIYFRLGFPDKGRYAGMAPEAERTLQ